MSLKGRKLVGAENFLPLPIRVKARDSHDRLYQIEIQLTSYGHLPARIIYSNYSVPLFNKEGLGEILLDKSPSTRFFKEGGEYLLFTTGQISTVNNLKVVNIICNSDRQAHPLLGGATKRLACSVT